MDPCTSQRFAHRGAAKSNSKKCNNKQNEKRDELIFYFIMQYSLHWLHSVQYLAIRRLSFSTVANHTAKEELRVLYGLFQKCS